jgi:predicted DNA-binding transcriptional regulator AlpA
MRKKLSKSSKVIRYIKKNPNVKASEVAKATGVSVSSVYQIVHKAKAAATKEPRGMKLIAVSTSNKPLMAKADMVNHPPHYKAGGIETIDFIEAKNLGYHLGNVVKYVSRADLKGAKLEDLQKAKWYLDRAISNLSKI